MGPLSEAARARLCGNLATHRSTSGSNHDTESESFADMIYGYDIIDQNGSQGQSSPSNFAEDCDMDHIKGLDSKDNVMFLILTEKLREILEGISSSTSTEFGTHLLGDAEKAVVWAKEKAGFNASENAEQKNRSRRFVMKSLRFAGYNAAICKSRWEKTVGHPAGDHEFIDVVIEESKLKNERFFVDIDFRAQFEIARPTDEYNALLQQIPVLFVGRADKLCEIIKIMCDAVRRSLRARGMCIPPWRKYRYMKPKWVGPYRRTTDPASSRGAQGSCNEYGALLQFPFSGIAIKGTGWNASVVHELVKANGASKRSLKAKSRSTKQANEQVGSPDCLLTTGEQEIYVKVISGLATALAEAGLIPLCAGSSGT